MNGQSCVERGQQSKAQTAKQSSTADAQSFCVFCVFFYSQTFGSFKLTDLTSYFLSTCFPLMYSTTHSVARIKEGTWNCSVHDNISRWQAQHRDWTKISWTWQSSKGLRLHCSILTLCWWFFPIRKYVSNSYTFMNMDQCGGFVLSTQWLQSSTSQLGDDTLARLM